MKKISITLSFEDEKLDALEFSLQKEKSSVQSRMDEALRQLYEQTVPEPVREYLDSKSSTAAKPKRPPRPAPPKVKPEPPAVQNGEAYHEK